MSSGKIRMISKPYMSLLLGVLLTLPLQAVHAVDWRDAGTNNDIAHRYLLDDRDLLSRLHASGSDEVVRLTLPGHDGAIRQFDASASHVMHPELAARYPEIRTFRAVAVDDASVRARITITSTSLTALIFDGHERVFIEPDGGERYRVYAERAYKADRFRNGRPAQCAMQGDHEHHDPHRMGRHSQAAKLASSADTAARTFGSLRRYRLAVAATAGFSADIGGARSTVLASIVSTIDRINEVYENYLGITLELVADNDSIIFLTELEETTAFSGVPGFFGYSEFNLAAQLDENQALIDSVIGSANYDIGHVFSSTDGGIASLGVVCNSGSKARGATGLSGRTGDPFDIDLVAHEIGHQFDADHSFNGTSESCGGGRNAATAFEPGSGTSIMSYAGLCSEENVDSNAFAGFHAGTVEQIVNFSRIGSGSSCGSDGANAGNNAPSVDGGADYTIPGGTPFVLTGTANDIDGDTLMYRWDEYDNSASPIQATTSCTFGKDLGSNPLFRSYPESSDPVRFFPDFDDLTANALQPAETLPLTDRQINFRFSAQDGKGGVDEDDVSITVDSTKGPFVLLQPNGGEVLDSAQLQRIEWHTACTENAPVNCTQVDIELSTDGGENYVNLATTSNDGVHELSFGSVSSTDARVRIRCSNNIFLDLSDADFTLSPGAGSTLGVGSGGIGSCGTSEVNNCAVTTGDDIEPNNSVAEAQAVVTPFSVNGAANDVLDPDDFFSFVASPGLTSVVLSDYGVTDFNLYLLDSDGFTILDESTSFLGTTESVSQGLVAGRTYYVQVQAFDTSGLDRSYRLSISGTTGSGADVEPNDSFDDAQLISLPFQIAGTVQQSIDDLDLFTFNATSDGVHNFILNNFGGNNLDIIVYDGTRTQLAAAANQFEPSEFIALELTSGARYFVEVRAVETANLESSYVLSISPAG